MLEAKIYSKQELFKELHITKYTWEQRKDDFLEHLQDYCDYKYICEGGKTSQFEIYEVYGEYYPLPRKSNREQKEKDYEDFTLKHLREHPINTVANVARNAIQDEILQDKYHHKIGAAQNYIRPVMKSDKLSKGEYYWCQLVYDEYIPINEMQLTTLKELFKKCGSHPEVRAKVESGEITREEAKEELYQKVEYDYNMVMEEFTATFGFRPVRAAAYAEAEQLS